VLNIFLLSFQQIGDANELESPLHLVLATFSVFMMFFRMKIYLVYYEI